MRMMPIASGSSGNCIYLGTEDTHVLFDAGVSRKRIEEGLNTAGLSLKDIDAIFVTWDSNLFNSWYNRGNRTDFITR